MVTDSLKDQKIKNSGAAKRRRYLLISVFALFFTNIMYNLLDCYFHNVDEFDLIFKEIFLICLISTVIGTALLFFLLQFTSGCRNRMIFDISFGCICALVFDSWLQITFLNRNLGLLDGNERPDFNFSHKTSLTGMVILLSVFVIVFSLRKLIQKPLWRKFMTFLMAVLVIMEGSSLIKSYIGTEKRALVRNNYIFTYDKKFTVSANGNIIVIIMDAFSNHFLNEWLELFPDEAAFLHDFTYYDNLNSDYVHTYPSVLHFMTGYEIDLSDFVDNNTRNAWKSDFAVSSYRSLKEKGYKNYLYFPGHDSHITGIDGPKLVKNIFDNIEENVDYDLKYDFQRMFIELSSILLYRSLPQRLKYYYYDEVMDLKGIVFVETHGANTATYQNYKMFEELKENSLKAVDDDPYLIYQYMWGLHMPYNTGSACEYVRNSSSITYLDSVRGMMVYLNEYLQQLKEIGVYDNSAVIVMADHGSAEWQQPMFLIKEAGKTGEELYINSAPVDFSDFLNTILVNAGITPQAGTSFYDWKLPDKRTRTSYYHRLDQGYPWVPRYHTSEDASSNVYYGYVYTGDINTLHQKFIDNDVDMIIPMADCIY